MERPDAHSQLIQCASEFLEHERGSAACTNGRGVELDFSRPGRPTDNARVESFNGRLRQECLNAHLLLSLDDAKAKVGGAWHNDYNESRS